MLKALSCSFRQTILFTIFTGEHIPAQKGQDIERLNATNCFAPEKDFYFPTESELLVRRKSLPTIVFVCDLMWCKSTNGSARM